MKVFTIGHGIRPAEELVACLLEVGTRTLLDVRRFPASRPSADAEYRGGKLFLCGHFVA